MYEQFPCIILNSLGAGWLSGRACDFQTLIRNISKIRKLITRDATVTLVRSLILSRLDYCNALLIGSSTKLISKLQRVQNTAARIVAMSPKRGHVTPILKDLRWLPIQQRIVFKTLCLTFQCLKGVAPVYLQELLTLYVPTRSLRSQNTKLLQIPKTQSKSYGNRSFSFAAAVEWNALPEDLRLCDSLSTFKIRLKNHLFKVAFSN